MSLPTVPLSVQATEYIKVQLSAVESGQVVDPTFGTAQFAFVTENEAPESGDWITGSWETWVNTKYYARCLVGPLGAITLPVGSYDIWIKADLDPELVVTQIGYLRVY